MTRGDLVTIALMGEYGKPRPALVVQGDAFAALPSVRVLQLTSSVHDEHLIRITVEPSAQNGLLKPSQVMVDRAVTLPRDKVGPVFGRVDAEVVSAVNRALMRFLDLEGEIG